MRTVFQVVATMVVANAAVAYGAGAKDAAAKIKGAAATKAADVKAKATEAAAEVKAEATAAATDAKTTATEGVKKAEASAETSDSSSTPTAEEAKAAVQGAMEGQPANTEELAGARKSLIIPESAVLPESVLRFRAIYAGAESEKGYDAQGNKVKAGIEVRVRATTAVLEYGITDKLSAQFLVPYRLDGKAEVESDDDFTRTGLAMLIAEKKKELIHALGAAYTNNISAPESIQLIPGIPGATIPAGAPVKTTFDAIAAGLAANPDLVKDYAKTLVNEQKFQKGLGDIEIGAKYALSTVNEPWFDGIPFYTSIAAGVRLNSSKYAEATKKGETPVGRGTLDAAVRLNADYEMINGVQLQLENQSEFMVSKGKAWNYAEANKGVELDLAREGIRQLGYTKLVIAPGAWIDGADFLMLNARYGWNNDSKTKLGTETEDGAIGRSAQAGVSFDGLKLKLPVQLDYDRVFAARGRNVDNAFDANVVTLKLFYKF